MGHLSPKFTRQPQRDGQAVLCSGDRVHGTYRKVLVRYQKGRPEVPKVFTAQSQELRLVLDTRPAVHKSHWNLFCRLRQVIKKAFKWGIDRIGFVL